MHKNFANLVVPTAIDLDRFMVICLHQHVSLDWGAWATNCFVLALLLVVDHRKSTFDEESGHLHRGWQPEVSLPL